MANPVIIIFLLSAMLFNACGVFSPHGDDKNNEQIIFGNGGGFTGKINEYTLNRNGDLFLNNTLKGQINKIKTLGRSETEDVFSRLSSIDFVNFKFDHPGNIYYFVKLKTNTSIYGITWGDNRYPAPVKIIDFYQFLMAKVK